MNHDKHYSIVECGRCKRPSIAHGDKLSRKCPYCGFRIQLETTRVLAQSDNAPEAQELLRKIKAKLR